VDILRARIKERKEKEDIEKLRKARKKLQIAKNRQVNHLRDLGIQARKDNKTRIARLQEVYARNGLPTIELITPVREPDKTPTAAKKLLTTDEGHEGLVQVIRELEQLVPIEVKQEDEVNISTQTVVVKEEEEVPNYRESSPYNQSEVESMADSIDSIQNNADFVSLE
jgi:hypothetical protein